MNKNIKNINDYEVWNGKEWCNFDGIQTLEKLNYIELIFDDNSNLKCSLNHRIFYNNDKFKYAKNFKIDDTIDKLKIIDIKIIDKNVLLYDLLNVEKRNKYQTNNVISHNCAFVDNFDEKWPGIQQTLATGGDAVILSTPNGTSNWFYRTWCKAIEGDSLFFPVKLKWNVHPERDSQWRKEQDELLGVDYACQECDADFLRSGRGVFSGLAIKHYTDKIIEEPKEKRGNLGNLWIWKYPEDGKEYIIPADVARGDGSDYSAFHILDAETLEQVAEFKEKIDTREYGNLLVSVATEYNDALLAIENASMGWDVIQTAIEKEYKNLYYSHRQDILLADVDNFIKKGYDLKQKEDMVPGFTTSSKSRPLIINSMKKLINSREAIIKSERMTNEMNTFIYAQNGRPDAESGFNDDLILSYAIGTWIRNIALKLSAEGKLYNKQALKNISKAVMLSAHKQKNTKAVENYWSHIDDQGHKHNLKQWI